MGYWTRFSKPEQRANQLVFAAALVSVMVMAGVFVSGLQAQSARDLPEAKYTGGGPEACLKCHGGPQMTIIAETPHGDASDPHAPYAQQGCESCHGPGSFHVSRARGGVGFPALTQFGAAGFGDPAAKQVEICLACHAEFDGEKAGIGWTGTLHDAEWMTCSMCHVVHTNENPLADVQSQKKSCERCHVAQISQHDFEYAGISFERLTCSTCHDVHQLIGQSSSR